jgi:hypothetical protein
VTFTSPLQREWRQFQLLSRDSIRRLLDRVVVSRESDPVQFALWGAVLAVTPPLLVGVRKLTQYAFLQAVDAVDPTLTERILTAERIFFVLYGMLASALLAALIWEALYPDRQDQEIVGVLPVRPRTLAAARLSAAVAVSAIFSAAINLPAALVYSVGSLAHPVGSLPRVLAGHVVATMGGCAFVFLALVALRGIVAMCAGERVANKVALLLQFVAIVLLVEVFLFLPYVVLKLVEAMQTAGSSHSALPPVWFTALYFWMADGRDVFVTHAAVAASATSGVAVVAVLVSLGPAAWMGRRALHIQSRDRVNLLMIAAGGVARPFARRPAVRSIFLFGVASLTRNRRHVLVLARYLGMAIAAAILSVIAAVLRRTFQFDEPQPYLLAIPLVFIFFAIFGLRAAIAIPSDVDANWPFRLVTPTVDDAMRATRLLIVWFGILPIVLVWTFITLAVWPAGIALRTASLDFAAGLLVMEMSLLGWTRIPFATPYEPAPETLKYRWMWYLFFLLIFAKGGASLEFAAVQSMTATMSCLVVGAIAIGTVRVWRKRQGRRVSPAFDAVPTQIESLNLSEALN